jgi:hypothetical protein
MTEIIAGVIIFLIVALVISLFVFAISWLWRSMPWSAKIRARNEAALMHAGWKPKP